jgi:hypothetical protein
VQLVHKVQLVVQEDKVQQVLLLLITKICIHLVILHLVL